MELEIGSAVVEQGVQGSRDAGDDGVIILDNTVLIPVHHGFAAARARAGAVFEAGAGRGRARDHVGRPDPRADERRPNCVARVHLS